VVGDAEGFAAQEARLVPRDDRAAPANGNGGGLSIEDPPVQRHGEGKSKVEPKAPPAKEVAPGAPKRGLDGSEQRDGEGEVERHAAGSHRDEKGDLIEKGNDAKGSSTTRNRLATRENAEALLAELQADLDGDAQMVEDVDEELAQHAEVEKSIKTESYANPADKARAQTDAKAKREELGARKEKLASDHQDRAKQVAEWKSKVDAAAKAADDPKAKDPEYPITDAEVEALAKQQNVSYVDQVNELVSKSEEKSGAAVESDYATGGSVSYGNTSRETDATGKLTGGTGTRHTSGFGVGKQEVSASQGAELADGTKLGGKVTVGKDGGSFSLSETDKDGESATLGGSIKSTANEDSIGLNAGTNHGGGALGIVSSHDVAGQEDSKTFTLGLTVHEAEKPGAKKKNEAMGGNLAVGTDGVQWGANYDSKTFGDPEKLSGTFKVSPKASFTAKVTRVAGSPDDAPLYQLVGTLSGELTLGGSAGRAGEHAESEGTGSVGGALSVKIKGSVSAGHVYSAKEIAGKISGFKLLESGALQCDTLSKWQAALGLVLEGGALENPGDFTESMNGVAVEGSVNAEGGVPGVSAGVEVGGSASRTRTFRAEKLADGTTRVTVTLDLEKGYNAKGTLAVVGAGSIGHASKAGSKRSIAFDLGPEGDQQAFIDWADDASIEELEKKAAEGGAAAWTSGESGSEKTEGTGKLTVGSVAGTDGESLPPAAKDLGVGIGISNASESSSEIAFDKTEGVSSSGSGSQTDATEVEVAGATVGASVKHGGAASTKGKSASLTLDTENKDVALDPHLPSWDDVDGLRQTLVNVFTTEKTTLSGYTYSDAETKRLVGMASAPGWASVGGSLSASPATMVLWAELGKTFCKPSRIDNEGLLKRIGNSKTLEATQRTEFLGQLKLALQMRALNRFLGASGGGGQRLIVWVLEHGTNADYRTGSGKNAGRKYYWPPELSEAKGRWDKASAGISAIEQKPPIWEMEEAAREKLMSEVSTHEAALSDVEADLIRAKDAGLFNDDARAYNDMIEDVRGARARAQKLLHPVTGPVQVGPADATADHQKEIARLRKRLSVYKTQEGVLLSGGEAELEKLLWNDAESFDQSLSKLYDNWIADVRALREAYRQTKLPVEGWDISSWPGQPRSAQYEPDIERFRRFHLEAYPGTKAPKIIDSLKYY